MRWYKFLTTNGLWHYAQYKDGIYLTICRKKFRSTPCRESESYPEDRGNVCWKCWESVAQGNTQ